MDIGRSHAAPAMSVPINCMSQGSGGSGPACASSAAATSPAAAAAMTKDVRVAFMTFSGGVFGRACGLRCWIEGISRRLLRRG